MAYQHDPDGPNVDEGGFRAKAIAYYAVYAVIGIAVIIAIKILISDDDVMESAIANIRSELLNGRFYFSIDKTDDNITVKLWEPGIAAVSKKAYSNDTEAVKEWSSLKDSVQSRYDKIKATLLLYEVKDCSIIVIIVNEDNHERSLLVYNGEFVYDVVRDTKGE